MSVVNVGSKTSNEYIITFTNAYTNTPGTHGTPTALGEARYSGLGSSVGDYAIFNSADAYDTSLTHSAISGGLADYEAKVKGYYAIFLWSNSGYAYNSSLTKTTRSNFLSEKKSSIGTASIGSKYAVFAGGSASTTTSSGTTYEKKKTVDAYNQSLSRSSATSLGIAGYPKGVSVGNEYALFAGYGLDYSPYYSDTVYAYNTSLTRSSISLSVQKPVLATGSVGDYGLIILNNSSNASYYNAEVIDVFDTSLTRSNATSMRAIGYSIASASTGGCVLFSGGNNSSAQSVSKNVDGYDTSLTRSTFTDLNTTKYSHGGASVGKYILFAGGYDCGSDGKASATASNTVDSYDLDYVLSITIPKYSKYKFTESSEQETMISEKSKTYYSGTPISGYIIVNGNTNLTGQIS